MKKCHLVFGLVLICFSACKTVKFVASSFDKNGETCWPIVKDTAGAYTKTDEFILIGATLNGKCLEIEVEYSGGCGGDEWTLAWTGNLMKSLPPKASIYLHLKDDDACRAVVHKTVSFDIGSIYTGEVVLLLKDFMGELRYKPE